MLWYSALAIPTRINSCSGTVSLRTNHVSSSAGPVASAVQTAETKLQHRYSWKQVNELNISRFANAEVLHWVASCKHRQDFIYAHQMKILNYSFKKTLN